MVSLDGQYINQTEGAQRELGLEAARRSEGYIPQKGSFDAVNELFQKGVAQVIEQLVSDDSRRQLLSEALDQANNLVVQAGPQSIEPGGAVNLLSDQIGTLQQQLNEIDQLIDLGEARSEDKLPIEKKLLATKLLGRFAHSLTGSGTLEQLAQKIISSIE